MPMPLPMPQTRTAPTVAGLAGVASAFALVPPRAPLPLQGMTVLLVEDSRFACEVLRMMCHRSGARLRRADSLHVAKAHLRVYRPDALIVDLGLPDGPGESLIRDAATRADPIPVILGTSGDPDGRDIARDAGASGFLDKPIASLAAFQDAILAHMSDRPVAAISDDRGAPRPDTLALHDDLAWAARRLADAGNARQRRYLAGFVQGVARSAADPVLERAAAEAGDPEGFARLAEMLSDRIGKTARTAFGG